MRYGLVSLRDAAIYLGITPTRLRNLCELELVPCVGKGLYFSQAVLDELRFGEKLLSSITIDPLTLVTKGTLPRRIGVAGCDADLLGFFERTEGEMKTKHRLTLRDDCGETFYLSLGDLIPALWPPRPWMSPLFWDTILWRKITRLGGKGADGTCIYVRDAYLH